jgi:dihydrofolate reductase
MTSNAQGPKPRISIIVAMAKNRVIGAGNKLPWHLPADLKRFKALTMGHHIIMGRKTFESIGRILPGRTSVVVTRDAALRADGAVVVNDIESALAKCAGDAEAFVIGGEAIFKATLQLADRIYVTAIEKDFAGDTFFPELPPDAWKEISRENGFDDASKLAYSFIKLERNR